MYRSFRYRVFNIFFILLLFSDSLYSQVPIIEWQKCYGGTSYEFGTAMIKLTQGGYLLCGAASSSNGYLTANFGSYDAWLVRINDNGDVIWQKNYGGSNQDIFRDVLQTNDGGFLAVGETPSNNGDVTGFHGGLDAWVVKVNSTGVIEWQRALGGIRRDKASTVIQTPDGNYLVGGTTASTDGDLAGIGTRTNDDFWLVCMNSSGNILWQKTYGGSRIDDLHTIMESGDGNFILAGLSQSFDGDVSNGVPVTGFLFVKQGWVVKVDIVGNIIWEKTYGSRLYTSDGEVFNDVQPTSDGGIILTGHCSANGSIVFGHHPPGNEPDLWVVKLDALGNFQWQKVYGGTLRDQSNAIRGTQDGGWILTGVSLSSDFDVTNSHPLENMWLIKLSAIGVLEWQKCFGGEGNEIGHSVFQTADLGFMVLGTTTSPNTGDVTGSNGAGEFWLVKFSPATTVPIKLTNYDAVWQGNVVVNSWQTQQEVNSSHFEIERSIDAVSFIKAGSQPAAGNSATVRNYTFMDRLQQTLREEKFYYRLKMVDLDGSYSYSRIVEVSKRNAQTFIVSPNPVLHTLNIQLYSKKALPINLCLFDMTGKKIRNINLFAMIGNNNFKIDVTGFSRGSYLLVINAEETYRQQVLKL